MARLEWNGRECVNPPEGWRFEVSETHDKTWCWMAGERIFRGALYQGEDSPTEAEAKRACEAALLRIGVLDGDDEFYCPHLPSQTCKDEVRKVAWLTVVVSNFSIKEGCATWSVFRGDDVIAEGGAPGDLHSLKPVAIAVARALAALEVEAPHV